jgi:putative FmdB family regulatory protein
LAGSAGPTAIIAPVPIYEYKCTEGHNFEVVQKMTDEPVAACEECGAPVERVFHPVAVHFKGSGFYTTDYARSSAGKDAGKASSDGAKSSSDGNSKDASKSTTAADSGSKKEAST